MKHVTDLSDGEIDRMIDVNIRGTIDLLRYSAPMMGSGGRIITIGSVSAHHLPDDASSTYGMTKGAVASLVRGMARELGPRGITVNNVQPGPVDTDANPADGPSGDTPSGHSSRSDGSGRSPKWPPSWRTSPAMRPPISTALPWTSTAATAPDRHPPTHRRLRGRHVGWIHCHPTPHCRNRRSGRRADPLPRHPIPCTGPMGRRSSGPASLHARWLTSWLRACLWVETPDRVQRS
jgi:hypothetical protein